MDEKQNRIYEILDKAAKDLDGLEAEAADADGDSDLFAQIQHYRRKVDALIGDLLLKNI